MFNYPFTLDKTIFMPYDYINECFSTRNKTKLIETLIHEKLHIGQRFYENIWENYIQNQDSNWIKIKSDDLLNKMINESVENENNLLNKINSTFISNPDTWYENFKYIYKISDNYYYGQYVYNKKNKKISKKYYLIDKNNKKLIECNDILDEEHPYETYAYEISKKLIKN
jgi:hypothetical protein